MKHLMKQLVSVLLALTLVAFFISNAIDAGGQAQPEIGLVLLIEADQVTYSVSGPKTLTMVVSNASKTMQHVGWFNAWSRQKLKDTDIGDFIVQDAITGLEIERRPTPSGPQELEGSMRGSGLESGRTKRFPGSLDAFHLTNAGTYLVSGRAKMPCPDGSGMCDIVGPPFQLVIVWEGASSRMAVGGELAFWLEMESTRFHAGQPIPAVMVVSNQSSASRYYSEQKKDYFDTPIGQFQVFDQRLGQFMESFVHRGERLQSRGDKGWPMEPREVVRRGGHVERTFSLTNVGTYLISAKGLFRSTNWNPEPPGESFWLETPPIEIEILPPTNAAAPPKPESIPAPAPSAKVEGHGKVASITKQPSSSAVPQTNAPAVEPPVSSGSTRNVRFGLLVFLPVLLAAGWIVWRRRGR